MDLQNEITEMITNKAVDTAYSKTIEEYRAAIRSEFEKERANLQQGDVDGLFALKSKYPNLDQDPDIDNDPTANAIFQKHLARQTSGIGEKIADAYGRALNLQAQKELKSEYDHELRERIARYGNAPLQIRELRFKYREQGLDFDIFERI